MCCDQVCLCAVHQVGLCSEAGRSVYCDQVSLCTVIRLSVYCDQVVCTVIR